MHVGTTRVIVSSAMTAPGLAHLRNVGHHRIVIFKPRRTATAHTLVSDLNAALTGTQRPLTQDFAFVDMLLAHGDAYVPLPRGRLYLVDYSRARFAASNVTALRVSGRRVDATRPASTRVDVRSGGTLTHPPHAVPRDSYLWVHNHSAHLQQILLIQIDPAAPERALERFVRQPTQKRLMALNDESKPLRLIGLLSADRSVMGHYEGPATRYLIWTLDIDELGRSIYQPGRFRLITAS